jgi:hypothetical protein
MAEDSDSDYDGRLHIDLQGSERKNRHRMADTEGMEGISSLQDDHQDDPRQDGQEFQTRSARRRKRSSDGETTDQSQTAKKKKQDAQELSRVAFIKGKERSIITVNSKRIRNDITGVVGAVVSIEVSRQSLKVTCMNTEQRERLLSVNMLNDIRVAISKPYEPRNARDVGVEPNDTVDQPWRRQRWSKGVISGVAEDISEEEIVADTTAVKAVRITRKISDGNASSVATVPTLTVILYFEGEKPPTVDLGRIFKVNDYIPKTLRCYRCQGFFHMASRCSQNLKCSLCSGEHAYNHCPFKDTNETDSLCCANCGGKHSAVYKNCPFFVQAKQATKIAVKTGKSYADALKQIKDTAPDTNAAERSYPVLRRISENRTEVAAISNSENQQTQIDSRHGPTHTQPKELFQTKQISQEQTARSSEAAANGVKLIENITAKHPNKPELNSQIKPFIDHILAFQHSINNDTTRTSFIETIMSACFKFFNLDASALSDNNGTRLVTIQTAANSQNGSFSLPPQ